MAGIRPPWDGTMGNDPRGSRGRSPRTLRAPPRRVGQKKKRTPRRVESGRGSRIVVNPSEYLDQLKRHERSRIVELVFYDIDKDCNWYDRWSQSIITYFTDQGDGNKFIHVELVFEDGRSLGVDNVEPVHLDKKAFGRSGCRHLSLFVGETQYGHMLRKAEEYEERRTEFNYAGEQLNFLGCTPSWLKVSGGGKYVFCSQLVVLVMQEAGLLQDLVAHEISPNGMFKIAKERFKFLAGPTNSLKSEKFEQRAVVLPRQPFAKPARGPRPRQPLTKPARGPRPPLIPPREKR